MSESAWRFFTCFFLNLRESIHVCVVLSSMVHRPDEDSAGLELGRLHHAWVLEWCTPDRLHAVDLPLSTEILARKIKLGNFYYSLLPPLKVAWKRLIAADRGGFREGGVLTSWPREARTRNITLRIAPKFLGWPRPLLHVTPINQIPLQQKQLYNIWKNTRQSHSHALG